MNWTLLPTISAPMSYQMALDEKLFRKAKENPGEPPLLRFYYSSEPWITVGCSFRDAKDAARSELIKGNSAVPVAKRLTGGGCVLHGEDLIFSLIIRTDRHDRGLDSAQESYKRIHACVSAAFQTLGLDTRFYRQSQDLPKGDDCFTYPVVSDLSWKGRKVAGGAQKRSEGVLLHHESIRIPERIAPARLIEAIRNMFAEAFGAVFTETGLSPELFLDAAASSSQYPVLRG